MYTNRLLRHFRHFRLRWGNKYSLFFFLRTCEIHTYMHTYTHMHAGARSRAHTHTHTHTHYVDKVRLSGVFLTERKSKLIAFTLSPRDNMLTAEPACYGIWCWRAYFRFPQVQFWLKSNLNNSVHSPNAFPRVRRI